VAAIEKAKKCVRLQLLFCLPLEPLCFFSRLSLLLLTALCLFSRVSLFFSRASLFFSRVSLFLKLTS
jgi:hypothetical protein